MKKEDEAIDGAEGDTIGCLFVLASLCFLIFILSGLCCGWGGGGLG